MNLETFQNLPTESVARHVREGGVSVCVFPVNGTRRWFALEHPQLSSRPPAEDYLRIAGRRHIELYKLFFDHGIHTLLTPIFGPDILERGQGYRDLLKRGLVWFAENEDFREFYDAYDVRVRVYGETRRYLHGTPYADALDAYEALARRTAHHDSCRLFFGVCAHDAALAAADASVRFHTQHGRLPERHELVTAFYGEYVAPPDLFVGSDRPAVYDMPLVSTGHEDLYFTVSPSPYLDAHTLRAILYDHLYARRVCDESYQALSSDDWQAMGEYYTVNRSAVLGLGRRHESGRFWYPIPQVRLPWASGDGDD